MPWWWFFHHFPLFKQLYILIWKEENEIVYRRCDLVYSIYILIAVLVNPLFHSFFRCVYSHLNLTIPALMLVLLFCRWCLFIGFDFSYQGVLLAKTFAVRGVVFPLFCRKHNFSVPFFSPYFLFYSITTDLLVPELFLNYSFDLLLPTGNIFRDVSLPSDRVRVYIKCQFVIGPANIGSFMIVERSGDGWLISSPAIGVSTKVLQRALLRRCAFGYIIVSKLIYLPFLKP